MLRLKTLDGEMEIGSIGVHYQTGPQKQFGTDLGDWLVRNSLGRSQPRL